MRNKLLNLFSANKGRGSPFNVIHAEGETVIEVYDVIVASEADAAWFGGSPADSFAREMRKAKAGDTVRVRVNSPGGDVFAGVAMAQAIRESAANVIVHVDGYAASAASLLVAAASESVIAPGGMVMVHKAWTMALGNADDMRANADLLDKIDGQLVDTYVAKAGGDRDEWMARLSAETWFTAAEAVGVGLVTRVAEGGAKAKNSFDLSVYAKAPAAPVAVTVEPVPLFAGEQAAEIIAPVAEAEPPKDEIGERVRKLNARLALTAA
jgi:ATP-dependent Clp protease protease subunit